MRRQLVCGIVLSLLSLFVISCSSSSPRTPADEFVAVEQMPVEILHEDPAYPEQAKGLQISGAVYVQALVGKDGLVHDARVLKSSGTDVGFEEAAVEAAYRNRYKPALQRGKPVAVWVSYKVEFNAPERRSSEGYRGATWWMRPEMVDSALARTCGVERGEHLLDNRYFDSVGGLSCEVIPSFTGNRLYEVTVAFETGRLSGGECIKAFICLDTMLTSSLGEPDPTVSDEEIKALPFPMWRMTAWSTDETRVRLVLLNPGDAADSLMLQLQYSSTEIRPSKGYVRKALDAAGRPTPSKDTKDPVSQAANEFVAVEQMPVEIHHVAPEYPEQAMGLRVSGVVWVQALVGPDGLVQNARVLKASGTDVGFEEAAVAAAYGNRYKPAIQNGKPLAVWVSYKVDFNLRR